MLSEVPIHTVLPLCHVFLIPCKGTRGPPLMGTRQTREIVTVPFLVLLCIWQDHNDINVRLHRLFNDLAPSYTGNSLTWYLRFYFSIFGFLLKSIQNQTSETLRMGKIEIDIFFHVSNTSGHGVRVRSNLLITRIYSFLVLS